VIQSAWRGLRSYFSGETKDLKTSVRAYQDAVLYIEEILRGIQGYTSAPPSKAKSLASVMELLTELEARIAHLEQLEKSHEAALIARDANSGHFVALVNVRTRLAVILEENPEWRETFQEIISILKSA